MIPPVANRFLAGETAEAALDRAAILNERGIGAMLNRLGEHYRRPEPAAGDVAAYRSLLSAIESRSVRARLSVKPSQLGLDVAPSHFRENLARLIERAAEADIVVWIDMEDHTTTDATLAAYEAVLPDHPGGVGLCLQANLKRTSDDLERLADQPARVRLVKGAYDPPAEIAHTDRDRVSAAFETLLERALVDLGVDTAVATHDDRLVDRAIDLADGAEANVEFQMLMGVREDYQTDLATDHEVWQYVPYGGKWASYFYRRLSERKENLLFGLRAVLGN